MSYTVQVVLKNAKQRKSWHSFLKQQVKPFSSICKLKLYESCSGILDYKELDHLPSKSVGIAYQSGMSCLERDYWFSIIRLVAIYSENKISVKKLDDYKWISDHLDEAPSLEVPYFVYDGAEKCPVLLVSTWKDLAEKYGPRGGQWIGGHIMRPLDYLHLENGARASVEDSIVEALYLNIGTRIEIENFYHDLDQELSRLIGEASRIGLIKS